MKLKALRGHFLDGNVQAVGSVYEAPDKLARMLIQTGKAIPAPDEPVKPAKKKPMTVIDTPELVIGAVEKEKETP